MRSRPVNGPVLGTIPYGGGSGCRAHAEHPTGMLGAGPTAVAPRVGSRRPVGGRAARRPRRCRDAAGAAVSLTAAAGWVRISPDRMAETVKKLGDVIGPLC
jgi:hypothetical protein